MHEKKYCPKCDSAFECKAGTITQCQCYAVSLSLEERIYVEERFADCLCSDCLVAVKNEYAVFKEKFIFG
jgi:hypothetical protein